MSLLKLHVCLRRAGIFSARPMSSAVSATPAFGKIQPTDIQLDLSIRERVAPKIGDRDIVGYGHNGVNNYFEFVEFPCPAIRYGKNTPQFMNLKQKQLGDWNKLTLAEKKELYRGNFRKTYVEMTLPQTEYLKSVLILAFAIISVGSVFNICMKQFFYSRYPLPSTLTPEWQEAMLYRMLDQRQGKVRGVSSKYDFENKRWKE